MANVRPGSSNSRNSSLARRHRASANKQGRNANRPRRIRIDLQEPCVVRLRQLRKELNHHSCSQTIEWLLNKAKKSSTGNKTVQEESKQNVEHSIISSNSSSTSHKDAKSHAAKEPVAQERSEAIGELHELPPLDFYTFSSIQEEYMANGPGSWATWIESLPEEENSID